MTHRDTLKYLLNKGYEAYLVGGCVRDELLNKSISDYDIVTSATLDELRKLFPNSPVTGTQFKVVIVDGIEVAPFRGKTLQEDLLNRDFTINTLVKTIDGQVLDFLGGRYDLQHRIIRLCNDLKTIEQDPLRIVRACRFKAYIDGEFDFSTLDVLRDTSPMLQTVPVERIQQEVLKSMKIPQASVFFGSLEVVDALKYVFSSLRPTIMHPHGKWHKETIWEHCMIVGDSISTKFPIVKLAGYLHDVGKPQAHKESNYTTFKLHHKFGEEIVQAELTRLKFSNDVVTKVKGLVRLHMRNVKEARPKAIRRLLHDLMSYNCLSWRDWLRLRIADRRGNLCKEGLTFSEIRTLVTKLQNCDEEVAFSAKDLELSGGEIIKLFNLSPSPLIGEIQRYLVEFVLDTGKNERDVLILKTKRYLEALDNL